MTYISRKIEPLIIEYLEVFSIVALTGPRQSGKSTLLRNLLGTRYRYVTFDDYRQQEFFATDPEAFMIQYSDKVIFDEAQKVPLLFNYLKLAVDKDRSQKGKFIITGSSQFNLQQNVTESLAGRIGLLALMPFQFNEIPAHLQDDSIYKGSYPETVMMNYRRSFEWYSSYIETFVLRDVKFLANMGDLHDFRQFIRLLAVQAAQVLNMSTISRILGISVSTVKRWISVLETAYIIFLLPSYHNSLGKRIIKSPKVFFTDTGLLCFLTGVSNKEVYENGPMAGSIFENYIISEVRKKLLHSGEYASLYYFRTNHEIEVDLIIEKQGKREWIEVKKSATFKSRMLSPMESLLKPEDIAMLLYLGEEFPYKPNIHIINYKQYLL